MNANEFPGRFLGVLGGMGPMAGAAFMTRLVALTPASSDQQHIPAVLWSDPRVPDRPSGYLGTGADPLPSMQHGLRQLQRAGCQAIAIPCNTAHLWYDKLAAASPLRVLHIVQAVIQDLRRNGIEGGRVGLLGTAVTLKLRLYQDALEAQGYECVTLSEDELQRNCAEAIRLVKFNLLGEAAAPAADSVRLLQAKGVDAVVLGCTELPLALPLALRGEFGTVISDSIDALALASIDWFESKHD